MDVVEDPCQDPRAGRAPAADSNQGGAGLEAGRTESPSPPTTWLRRGRPASCDHSSPRLRSCSSHHSPSPTNALRTGTLRRRQWSKSPPLGASPRTRQRLRVTFNINDQNLAALLACRRPVSVPVCHRRTIRDRFSPSQLSATNIREQARRPGGMAPWLRSPGAGPGRAAQRSRLCHDDCAKPNRPSAPSMTRPRPATSTHGDRGKRNEALGANGRSIFGESGVRKPTHTPGASERAWRVNSESSHGNEHPNRGDRPRTSPGSMIATRLRGANYEHLWRRGC